MKMKHMILLMVFTVLVCAAYVAYNPTITDRFESDYSDGEVIRPVNGVFDLKKVALESPKSKSFTARLDTSGHVMFYDDTGDRTVNIIEYDKMIHLKRDGIDSFLRGELEKPSWVVDGVCVHQIDFRDGSTLYSAYIKNSTADTVVYIATPNEKETADLANSVEFK